MKINKKRLIIGCLTLLGIFFIAEISFYSTLQNKAKQPVIQLAQNVLYGKSPSGCLQYANQLLNAQRTMAAKEAAMKMDMSDMSSMEHVTISLNKSLYSKKLNTCLASLKIVITKGQNVISEQQIYSTDNDQILAQLSNQNNNNTSFIFSLKTGLRATGITTADMTQYEKNIGLD